MMDRVRWTPPVVRLMAGLMLSLFVAAMDATVVGTALPTIANELGEFALYPWVFSGYLITATTSVPLWGRTADLHGRRRVLLIGMAVFVVASVLCAASPGMGWLITFRTLQGIGAGCIQPLVFTIVGDVFPVAQRARLQGLFSAMWAIAAMVGPGLGALLISTVGWRWIFLINLPIGIVAAALVWGYREHPPESRPVGSLDVRSGVLMTAGIALLLWGLGTGSSTARPSWPVLAGALVVLALFVWVERRSASPILPVDLLRHRAIGPAVLVTALAGTVMFGVTAYLPLYVQHVLGRSVFAAGLAVGAMSIGWPLASAASGWVIMRVGYQRLAVAGAVTLLVGTLLLPLAPRGGGVLWAGAASGVIGLGMGLFSAPLLIVIQSSVEWGRRGAATALNQFSRTIGGAIGVSLMGVLLEAFVGSAANPLAARGQLAAGLQAVFWVLVGLSILVLLTALAILRWSPALRTSAQPDRRPEEVEAV